MPSSFYGKPSPDNARTPKPRRRSGILATKRRRSALSNKDTSRRKRPRTRVKHRKSVLSRKNTPQITVVYGKLHSKMCGHCIALEPTWDEMVDYFEHHNSKSPHSRVIYKEVSIESSELGVGIAEVNNTYLSNSSTKMESPMGFPTIFRIYDGKLEYFNGNRDFNTLVRWVSRDSPSKI